MIDKIKELDEYWSDLLYNVCEGKASEMAVLRGFDIIEFFDYVNNKSKDG